jgi:ABC-type multidrug transport system ATPase subunit
MPRAAELLERFELTDAADRPLRTYSGGMRRRLDVAASLMTRPPVLFLDEPTTGLDLTSRNALWGMIEQLVSEGTTVLLTTQYLEEADRLAARIAVVDGGKVIANDAPSHLKAELGSTVAELRFHGVGGSERATELLTGHVNGRVEHDDGTVRITAEGGARILVEVLRILDNDGLEPDGLTVREPSLDDVFLSLTGHHAEAGDATEGTEPAPARRERRGG